MDIKTIERPLTLKGAMQIDEVLERWEDEQ
jgi:hypothetical protein